MRKLFLLFFIFIAMNTWAQQKFALVIGNGDYINIPKLNNPINDANDMAGTLSDLGFTVDKVINGSLTQMEDAITKFRNRLSISKNAYGFFYYAGHGIQSGGVNYLLPVNANIPSESYLRERTVSVQSLMQELNESANELNIIILDACRDNPFSWSRSNSRGLALVSAPAGSILMYATSANSTAADGNGRNGLFTAHLLNNMRIPNLNVLEMFNKTGQDVLRASNGAQHPEISVRHFGNVYLGNAPQGSDNTAYYIPNDTKKDDVRLPIDTPDQKTKNPKPISFGLSAGGVLGLTTYNYYDDFWDDNVSGILINILNPTVNFRLLFPFENKLQLGLGIDLTVAVYKIDITYENDDFPITGTIAPYGIIGYKSFFAHLGYDFAYGALYFCPAYVINKHLMVSIPMSLFGSNHRFGITSSFTVNSDLDIRYYQFGLSVQYVF